MNHHFNSKHFELSKLHTFKSHLSHFISSAKGFPSIIPFSVPISSSWVYASKNQLNKYHILINASSFHWKDICFDLEIFFSNKRLFYWFCFEWVFACLKPFFTASFHNKKEKCATQNIQRFRAFFKTIASSIFNQKCEFRWAFPIFQP